MAYGLELLSRVRGEVIIGAIAALVASGFAAAETVLNPPDSPKVTLEEVLVTAQKRPERLQDVALSAQVIPGEMLEQHNNLSLEELTQTVPGVHISSGDFSDNLFIRGIGSGSSNPSYDQSVSVFTDDIYHGRSRLSEATFLDLERIEILKGPQSTYLGNNAIAGALNIVTRKPGSELSGGGRLLYGQFGQYTAEAAMGGPINPGFGARVAITANGVRDGWIDNLNLGHRVPQINNLGGRLTLTAKTADSLDATLKIEGSRHRTTGSYRSDPSQWVNCPPPAPIAPSFSGVCKQALAMGAPLGLDSNQTEGLPGQGNWLSTEEDVLTLNYHLGSYTITSVSGFNKYDFSAHQDDGLLPVFIYKAAEPVERYHQWSEEIRVASPTGGRIEWLAGGYLQSDTLRERIIINAPFLNGIVAQPKFQPLAPYLPLSFETGMAQNESVYSLFGSLSWNITSQWKLTGGLRGTQVGKAFRGTLDYGTSGEVYGARTEVPANIESLWSFVEGSPGTQQLSRSDRALMPSMTVQYQIAAEAMAYAKAERGFKSGGFNALLPLLTAGDVQFGRETVNAYEFGLKTQWLEGRLRANADFFLSDYAGLQSNTVVHQASTNTNAPIVRNAAKSRSEGFEFEGEWLVLQALRLAADVTYLDSRYLRYPNATATTLQQYCAASYVLPYCSVFQQPVPATADLSGQPTAEAPRWSGNIRAEYRISLPHDLALTTEISSYLTQSYSATGANPSDPLYRVPRYARLDARVSFGGASGRWGVDVIGKNLTDRIIVSNIGGSSSSLYSGSRESPSSIAIQVRFRW